MADPKTVLVTGANGFLASWLVKLLLEKGYTVHATVRDPENEEKTRHLKALPFAAERLRLFPGDLQAEGAFDDAVRGCGGVFHTASPVQLVTVEGSKEKDLVEPALQGTLNVLRAAARAEPPVRRVVLTTTMLAVNQDDTRPADKVVDESSWSREPFLREHKAWYALSKTIAERAAWEFAAESGLDLVTVAPTLVVGKMLQPGTNETMALIAKLVTGEWKKYPNEVRGLVHVEDVADTHLRAYETPTASGRYLCIGGLPHYEEVCAVLRRLDPTLPVPTESANDKPKAAPYLYTTKRTTELGVQFTDLESMLRDCLETLRARGIVAAAA